MSFFGKSFIVIFLLFQICNVLRANNLVSVIETLNTTDPLEPLFSKVKNLSMIDEINKIPKLTIFAPGNKGIETLNDKTHVKNILRYHMISELFNATEYNVSSSKRTIKNLLDIPLTVNVNSSSIKVANVTLGNKTDAINGTIFSIGTLFPTPGDVHSEMMKNPKLTTLRVALDNVTLSETLKTAESITLFAPTNDVFTKNTNWMKFSGNKNTSDLKKFLQHHFTQRERLTSSKFDSNPSKNLTMENSAQIRLMKDNKGLTVNGISINGTEIHCINGIIYVIDQFLVDPKISEKSISSKHQYNIFIVSVAWIVINGFF